jgi:hypothetical protein
MRNQTPSPGILIFEDTRKISAVVKIPFGGSPRDHFSAPFGEVKFTSALACGTTACSHELATQTAEAGKRKETDYGCSACSIYRG